MSIQHAYVSMSLRSFLLIVSKAHGAMIARAFGVGMEISPCCDDAEPMGVVELGTASSQPSSWRESCWPLSVYHEPACEGLRVTMLAFECRRMENKRLKGAIVTVVSGMIVGARGVAACWWGRSCGVVRLM
jgi:hypothetical protein